MAESFNVNEYWLDRGQSYIKEQRLYGPYHRLQEQYIIDVIRRGDIPNNRVLELGCGFGRVTRLLAENFPTSHITAVDLSSDQLENARDFCHGKPNIIFQTYDFYSDAPLPGGEFDLAIGIEVFLHHPADVISRLISRLARVSRCILNVDWSEPWPWNTPEHVWVHDYARLYGQAQLQCATFVLPQKVDRKQQKLFIAGHELPARVVALERELALPDQRSVDPPEDWLHQLHRAELDVKTLIPSGSTCILVDENHWGESSNHLNCRMLPFLEHNGEYWGLPPDDETAIREIERMRRAGADYAIFPWHSFWWFDHYQRFHQYLHATYRCVAATDHLIAFKLN